VITIRFAGRKPVPLASEIGMETDQEAEKLRFLLPQVADNQSAFLMLILPDGSADALQLSEGMATLPARATSQPGRIRAWVEIQGAGGVAWNSGLLYLDVGDVPPISEEIEQQYPTAIQEALAAAVQVETYLRRVKKIASQLGQAMLASVVDDTLVFTALNYDPEEEEELDPDDEDALITVGQWEAMEDAVEAAQAAADAADARAETKSAIVTIASTDWTGTETPYTAVKSCTAATATNHIIAGLSGTATSAQHSAAAEARILCTAQAAGSLTFKAFGAKPDVDIPVSILGVNP